MRKVILIPTRINSKRLPAKALLKIENIPMIIHTYKRSCLSKLKDEVYICTDSQKIIDVCKKYEANFIRTKSSHKNGTERIAEAARKLKLKKKDVIIDVQGDEPLINPKDIDSTVNFFIKNKFDIVVPHINIKLRNKSNIVKLLVNDKNKIMWMTRSDAPCFFKAPGKFLKKHLSIIVFDNDSLTDYSKLKTSHFEKIESIELLRGVEANLSIGTFREVVDTLAVDNHNDLEQVKRIMAMDSYHGKY